MSLGSRSGVHWIRLNDPLTAWASVDAAVVLARPGTLSRRMWPPVNRPMSSVSCSRPWPTTLPPNASDSRSNVSPAHDTSSVRRTGPEGCSTASS